MMCLKALEGAKNARNKNEKYNVKKYMKEKLSSSPGFDDDGYSEATTGGEWREKYQFRNFNKITTRRAMTVDDDVEKWKHFLHPS